MRALVQMDSSTSHDIEQHLTHWLIGRRRGSSYRQQIQTHLLHATNFCQSQHVTTAITTSTPSISPISKYWATSQSPHPPGGVKKRFICLVWAVLWASGGKTPSCEIFPSASTPFRSFPALSVRKISTTLPALKASDTFRPSGSVFIRCFPSVNFFFARSGRRSKYWLRGF